MDYSGLTDEQILQRYRAGDREALDYLLEKYKNMVRSKTRTYFLIGGDREDLSQEGMIGLFKAVRYYDAEKDSSFASFAELCVTGQVLTAIKAANRQKHRPLNAYVSLDRTVGEEGAATLEDTLAGAREEDPERLLIVQENLNKIYEKIEHRLSKMEKQVLRAYLDGQSYQQIAQRMGKTAKSIDNALQRVKKKLGDV